MIIRSPFLVYTIGNCVGNITVCHQLIYYLHQVWVLDSTMSMISILGFYCQTGKKAVHNFSLWLVSNVHRWWEMEVGAWWSYLEGIRGFDLEIGISHIASNANKEILGSNSIKLELCLNNICNLQISIYRSVNYWLWKSSWVT